MTLTEDIKEFLARNADRRPKMEHERVVRNWMVFGMFAFAILGTIGAFWLAVAVTWWLMFLVIPIFVINIFVGNFIDWYDWKYKL